MNRDVEQAPTDRRYGEVDGCVSILEAHIAGSLVKSSARQRLERDVRTRVARLCSLADEVVHNVHRSDDGGDAWALWR